MVISYDSAVTLTVTKANWYESWMKMYSLDTKELVFEEKIGGD